MSKTFAGKIADWLNTGKARTQAFTLGERNFQPASDGTYP